MAMELVKCVDLDPIFMGDEEESIHFRVEVFRIAGKRPHFISRIRRWETYFIHPSFPIPARKAGKRSGPFDVKILVCDVHFEGSNFEEATASRSLSLAVREIRRIFSVR